MRADEHGEPRDLDRVARQDTLDLLGRPPVSVLSLLRLNLHLGQLLGRRLRGQALCG